MTNYIALAIPFFFLLMGVELWLARPDAAGMAFGFVPQASILRDPSMLYIATSLLHIRNNYEVWNR